MCTAPFIHHSCVVRWSLYVRTVTRSMLNSVPLIRPTVSSVPIAVPAMRHTPPHSQSCCGPISTHLFRVEIVLPVTILRAQPIRFQSQGTFERFAAIVRSWRNDWEQIIPFFDYPLEIRKIVYTTNIIESLNRGIRKYTKTKSVFPHDQAALKSVYLAISNIEIKWKYPIRDWGIILQQFLIKFEDRCRI